MDFDLYFAGVHSTAADIYMQNNPNICRLLSFVNDKTELNRWITKIKNKECSNKLFMDSGAFSAYTQGIQISVQQLVDFVNDIGETLHIFANLDVIPKSYNIDDIKDAANKGFDNFIYIQKNCKYANKCLGVYHYGEPQEILDKYVNYYLEHPELQHFALGGMVGKDTKLTTLFAINTCKYIKKYLPKVKIHLFGFTSLPNLPLIPCDSADSTKWIMVSANGNIITPFGSLCVSDLTKFKQNSVFNLPTQAYNVVEKFVNKFGFTMKQLSEDYTKRDIFNIAYLQQWSQDYKYKGYTKSKKSLI